MPAARVAAVPQAVELDRLRHRGLFTDLPGPRQAGLLEAALVAAVDHGPQTPSIAVARMAATCGIGLNGAC